MNKKNCAICGVEFAFQGHLSKRSTCGKPECAKARRRKMADKWFNKTAAVVKEGEFRNAIQSLGYRFVRKSLSQKGKSAK